MRISIIVPFYNEVEALPGFLDAIERVVARRRDVELLLVDGNSSDGSVAVARARGHAVLGAPRGRASQMNAGATAARGDVLLFLHVDTRLPDDGIERMMDAVADGATGGWFELRLDSSRPLLWLAGRLITLRSRLTGVATGDQAIFVSRQAFRELGGYALLPLFEDIDLCRRLKRLGRVVRLAPAVTTSARRWERMGVWPTILRMWALRLLYYAGVKPERLARYYGSAR